VMGTLVSYLLMQSGKLRSATLDLRTRQLEEERARKLAAEARLATLESRIHPHFLFNSLNSIAALIREDPAGAERMTERLAGLLRYSLDTNSSALVPLEQELRLVRDYLDIERTRFGERLRFSVDAPAQIADLKVPPLALQTLVENSIKYAIATRREGGEIRVAARREGDLAVLEVSDDGPGFEAGALKPEHGLDNLRERVAGLFEGRGRVDVARREGRTVVSVVVPAAVVSR
jgi:two-component system, LytTR family, sensor histidine kinase AlgZ